MVVTGPGGFEDQEGSPRVMNETNEKVSCQDNRHVVMLYESRCRRMGGSYCGRHVGNSSVTNIARTPTSYWDIQDNLDSKQATKKT